MEVIYCDQILPNDIMNELLYNADVEQLPTMCNINKNYYALCSSETFWIEKCKRNNIPYVGPFNSLEKYCEVYTKIKNIKFVVLKFVNYILDKKDGYCNTWSVLTDYIDIDDINFFPLSINNAIKSSKNDADRQIDFYIGDNFNVEYYYTKIEQYGYADNYTYASTDLSKDELITYITTLFYHIPLTKLITSTELSDDSDSETMNEAINDFVIVDLELLCSNKIDGFKEW